MKLVFGRARARLRGGRNCRGAYRCIRYTARDGDVVAAAPDIKRLTSHTSDDIPGLAKLGDSGSYYVRRLRGEGPP